PAEAERGLLDQLEIRADARAHLARCLLDARALLTDEEDGVAVGEPRRLAQRGELGLLQELRDRSARLAFGEDDVAEAGQAELLAPVVELVELATRPARCPGRGNAAHDGTARDRARKGFESR